MVSRQAVQGQVHELRTSLCEACVLSALLISGMVLSDVHPVRHLAANSRAAAGALKCIDAQSCVQ